MTGLRHCLAGVGLALLATGSALARGQDHAGHALGKVHFPISCRAEAQAAFDHALALLHHMTYPQARVAFEETAKIDPECSMAHWGIAMTLFQPLWPTRPDLPARQRGWDAVQKAKAHPPTSGRERLFIAAAEAFFEHPGSSDYWLRIRRWEQASAKLLDSYPQDPEAAAFYALAHLAVVPPDQISRENADRAAEILLRVYEKNPDHPGAMHYLVHANDVPGRERELLAVTRRYEQVAPDNPHALHMPTHIYTRLGDWDGVIRGNLRAAEAALEHPAGQYVWDEFPHAIEYLVYAYLQKGDVEAAAEQLARLRGTPRLEPTFKTAFHLASTRARFALERRAWDEALAIEPREPASLDWDRFPWPESIAWFARGLGAARLGKLDAARAASRRLAHLGAAAAGSGEQLFSRSIRVLELGLKSWIAQAETDSQAAVRLMKDAAALESSTPKHAVTPAPTLPALELLGDLLMTQGRHGEALDAYRRSLDLYPNRLNSLRGVAESEKAARGGSSMAIFRDQRRAIDALLVSGE